MNTIETTVLNMIGENTTSPDVFTDDSSGMAQIRESINDAIEEICLITGSTTRTYHVPMESAVNLYRFGSTRDRFAWFKSVWLLDVKRKLEQKSLVWLNQYDPGWMKSTGPPVYYCPVYYDKFLVYPRPSATTDMLEVNAVVIPDRYTEDTDRIKIRKSFQFAVSHYAVSEYWASRGDAATAMVHWKHYMTQLGMFRLFPTQYDYRARLAARAMN